MRQIIEQNKDLDVVLTLFHGRAGDRNRHAFTGASMIANALSMRIGLEQSVIGSPENPLNANWNHELDAAKPALLEMAKHFDEVLSSGKKPLTVMPRCAVGLATLPVVARHYPDACVVWFDAHADLNIPEQSDTGYLGGMVLSGAAGVWDTGLGSGLKLDNIVLTGVRDIDPFEHELISRENISLAAPSSSIIDELRRMIAGRPVYIHIDCDVFDKGILPSEYQVSGGFSFDDFYEISLMLAEEAVIGLEIAEYQSSCSHDGCDADPERFLDTIQPLLN